MPLGARWSIRFDVAGVPKGKGSMRAIGGGRVVNDDPGTSRWQTDIGWAAVAARNRVCAKAGAAARGLFPYGRAVGVAIVFYLEGEPTPAALFPIQKRDVDKLARCVLDALTEVLYADDGQVVSLEVVKEWAGRRSPGCSVTVWGW